MMVDEDLVRHLVPQILHQVAIEFSQTSHISDRLVQISFQETRTSASPNLLIYQNDPLREDNHTLAIRTVNILEPMLPEK